MIIYFLESNKIYTFKLPLEVSGNYILSDYDINGNKRSLLSVEARDGKWVINDNDEVKIYYNNKYNREATLDLYHFYQLVICGEETLLMYIAPAYDNTFICTRVQDGSKILCGNDGCDINFPIIGKKQLEITYKKGSFTFKNLNPNIPIYINNSKKELGSLNNFDVIFIMGLRILILGGNIYINNPNNQVVLVSNKFSKPQLNLLQEDYQANSEFYRDFYDEKDYFYKTPVFQNALDDLSIPIAQPPQKISNKSGTPMLMQIGPSALMSISSLYQGFQIFNNISSGQGNIQDNMSQIIMCVTLLISSFVWPFIEKFYEKIAAAASERRREKIYTKYLKEKRAVLSNAAAKQKAVLTERYLSLQECREAINTKNPNLFSRGYDNPDFLSVRLGVGNVDLYANIEFSRAEFEEDTDRLVEKAQILVDEFKVIKDVPYPLSLYDKNITAFIGSNILKNSYINSIVLQLITYQNYGDLRLVILSDNAAPSCFHYLKESNYCFNDDKSFRFYSESFEEGQAISEVLEKIFTSRATAEQKADGMDKSLFPYYLIISDNISMYKNLKIIDDILESKTNYGFGILMFDDRVNNIPDGCINFVNYTEKEGYYFTSQMSMDSIRKFKPDLVGTDYIDVNIDDCISKVSNIPLRIETDDSGMLPDNLGFLEMYGVGKLEQLNILSRWENSNIVNSLTTPIGVDANGNLLYLDLHEKKHGPHGLVAGMTGSGKSETIVTYLLSLAINYSPYEVQFVLIDYKGGGLAGAFENRKTGVKIPHLVGTITNLDQSEMKRTLVSIKSELQRRQRLFNSAKEQLNTGTIDIYKYQRLVRDGKLDIPLSHLFIVCDEFAELKAQQPDFMDELVSAARIGRSLGVHLILATQKPSGVVDDQIWSNSKFKICCKVQTAEDSNEMIRRPDAAFIKEAGRFYLQVGYDEYFIKGQSAYTGGAYVPSDKIRTKYSTSIEFIDNQADLIKSVDKDSEVVEAKEDLGEELGNIIKYVIENAKAIGYENSQLWLDNVPTELYLDDLRKKYPMEIKKNIINPLIGEYDDPRNQKQGPVSVNLTTDGNVWISGVYGSGKTTLVSTIIYSTIITHNTEEVNIYIVDLLAETLKMFANAPQVGDFISVADADKLKKLFFFLNREVARRKNYFSTKGGTFAGAVSKGDTPFPNIVVVINGMDVFRDEFDEIYDDLFVPLTRDCNRVGITFIITSTGSMTSAVDSNFPNKIALHYLDASEYSMIYNNTNGVIPGSNPGRGLIELDQVYEFQSAIIFNELYIERNLSYVIEQLNQALRKASSIPVMPKIVEYDNIKNDAGTLDNVPIGIEFSSNCIYNYDFNRFINFIVYGDNKTAISFENAFLKILQKTEKTKVIVLDALLGLNAIDEIQIYTSNFIKICESLYNTILKKQSTDKDSEKIVFVISNYQKIQSHLHEKQKENNSVKTIDDLIMAAKDAENYRFIIINDNRLKSVGNKEWSDYADVDSGIIIGLDPEEQGIISCTNSYDDVRYIRDFTTVVTETKRNYIKIVRDI